MTTEMCLTIAKSDFERFYSKYYGERVKFPRNQQLRRIVGAKTEDDL